MLVFLHFIFRPVAITVQEILADAGFETLNTTTIKAILDSVKTKLDAASGANAKLTFVEVPDLFLGDPTKANFATAKTSFAFSPGLVNAQFIGGKSYFPRAFAPVVGGKDIFEDEVVKQIGATAEFVDDWTLYHDRDGEVHCGSLVKRDFLIDRWWIVLP